MCLDCFSPWSWLDVPVVLQKWTEVLREHFWEWVYADESYDGTTPAPQIPAVLHRLCCCPTVGFSKETLFPAGREIPGTLLRGRGFTARSALEVNTNYMSFTPRALTCLGLPFWHKGFREHPALQWILSVQCPALQHIPLCGVLFPREELAFDALKK